MAYVSLYRKYRPSSWDKVIGQNHIVKTLVNQIASGTVGHAYLFTGTRGTGKTSSAKIFARAVNCLHPVNGSPCGECEVCKALAGNNNIDIIEMDAASNNGVDEIRDLKESVQFPPTVGKYKVYIIDEVHMLSPSAFNALLKTLEEPPSHVIFILATTEVHKLPQTILSRCMRFDFRLVSAKELADQLARIFDDLGYSYEPAALDIIASHGEGSVRDTLSLADMCLSYAPEKLTVADVLEVLGASDYQTLEKLSRAILSGDVATVLAETENVYARGKGLVTLNKELCDFFRELITVKNVPSYRGSLMPDEYELIKNLASGFDNYRISRVADLLAGAENELRYTSQPRVVFEAILVKATEMKTELNIDALLSRVDALEKQLRRIELNGVTVTTARSETEERKQEEKIKSVISSFAVQEEAPAVFEEQPKPPKRDPKADMIAGSLITALRESDHPMLTRAMQKQDDYSLSGKIMTYVIGDTATLSLLADNENVMIVENALRSVTDNDYSFVYTTPDKGGKQGITQNDRAKLADLFGDTLTDRKKNK